MLKREFYAPTEITALSNVIAKYTTRINETWSIIARQVVKSYIGNFVSHCCGDYFQMLCGKRTCIRQSLSVFWSRAAVITRHNESLFLKPKGLPINQSDVLHHCWAFHRRNNAAITLRLKTIPQWLYGSFS